MDIKALADPQPAETQPVVNLRCPVCGHEGAFHALHPASKDVLWTQSELQDRRRIPVKYRVGTRLCPNVQCRAIIFIVRIDEVLVLTYPQETIDFDATSLPENILSSLEEAVKCHSAACYRAAALMVRRVLEELCDNKNAKGRDLKAKIAALNNTILVPPELLEAADELRILGNDAAHIEAKMYDDIGSEEVALAIELTKELLKAVYQYTSLVARLKALKKNEAS